jgi:glycosyltransferase involved in cell wall biosynthesis
MSKDFKDFVSSLQNELNNSLNPKNEIIEPAGAPVAPAPAPSVGDKLKLLLISTHINQVTGYAKVSYGLINNLSKLPWLSLSHYAIQSMGQASPNTRKYPHNVELFDVITNEKEQQMGFGFKELPEYIKKIQPHIVMIYNDASIIYNYCEEIRKSAIPRTFKLWIYFDQVYPYHTPMFIENINKNVDRVFCFTKEWKNVAKSIGINRPLDVITHAFESDFFYPIPKEQARQALKIPNDAFVFMNMNRNQPRKRLDILVMSFVELIAKHPSKQIFLMCVTDAGSKGGFPLFDIFAHELSLRGLSADTFANRLMITSNDMSFKDHDINIIYNAADVGISTSEGEGFGLCSFEQMGVGVPQILSDVVGHREYANEKNSIIVPCRTRNYMPSVYSPMGGEINLVDYRDVAVAMEKYLLDDSTRILHGKAARESVQKYTWEFGLKHFVKRLKVCHEQLIEEGELD